MFNGYFKPTPKRLQKMALAFKTVLGTLALSSYAVDNPKIGFWLLVCGAAIDFIIQCFSDDEPPRQ